MCACTIVDSGIDWVTMTAPEGAVGRGLKLHAEALWYAERERGEICGPWSGLGYHGEKSGPVAFGTRYDGVIMIVSGCDAGDAFNKCYVDGVQLSRLDLQVTVRYDPARPRLTQDQYRAAINKSKGERRNCGLRIVIDSEGGSTVYVGSRSSQAFGRLYNKRAESKLAHYDGCWRWEVEWKGDSARATGTFLRDDGDWRNRVAEIVCQFYILRGLDPPPFQLGAGLPVYPIRPPTSVERQLEWLRTQVKGTVDELRAEGQSEEVLAALGLGSPVSTSRVRVYSAMFGSHLALSRDLDPFDKRPNAAYTGQYGPQGTQSPQATEGDDHA